MDGETMKLKRMEPCSLSYKKEGCPSTILIPTGFRCLVPHREGHANKYVLSKPRKLDN